MKTLCQIVDGRCSQCGESVPPTQHRTCPAKWPGRADREAVARTIDPGLGDYTEKLLSSIGVTKERFVELKEKFGLAPTCGCDARKQWLNEVGRYVGM